MDFRGSKRILMGGGTYPFAVHMITGYARNGLLISIFDSHQSAYIYFLYLFIFVKLHFTQREDFLIMGSYHPRFFSTTTVKVVAR